MLILPCIMLSQTFESLTSVRRTRGMSEDQGRIVLFGNGLTWINPAGDIVEELALIDGMTISDIRDVTVDGLGGLWVLTATELGHLSADRKIKPVFHISTFEKSEARKLKLLPDGTLLVLLRNKIIEVKF